MLSALLCAFGAALSVSAVQWTTVEWDADSFTSLSGSMTIPALPPSNGTPYVWPAVQSSNGVLQAVCDGRTGSWYIADGFYGNPSLPWGSGFSVVPGDVVDFTFTLSDSDIWTTTLTLANSNSTANSTFTLPDNLMNRVIFAVEYYDVNFTNGPVIYHNISITASTAASGWCNQTKSLGYNSSAQYNVTGAVADGNTCTIQELYMPSNP